VEIEGDVVVVCDFFCCRNELVVSPGVDPNQAVEDEPGWAIFKCTYRCPQHAGQAERAFCQDGSRGCAGATTTRSQRSSTSRSAMASSKHALGAAFSTENGGGLKGSHR
jgi:hypothetical protein